MYIPKYRFAVFTSLVDINWRRFSTTAAMFFAMIVSSMIVSEQTLDKKQSAVFSSIFNPMPRNSARISARISARAASNSVFCDSSLSIFF